MSDPRKKKPSASSFDRYMACPGSFIAALDIEQGEVSQDATDGTAIHDAIANQTIDQLPPNLQDTAYECIRLREEVVSSVVPAGFQVSEPIIEQRIWYFDIFSGQCDYILLWEDKGLIIDYKTGYVGAAPAHVNPQLEAYAVLVATEYVLREVTVAVVQPNVRGQNISQCTYDSDDLRDAALHLKSIISSIQHYNAPRKSGKHCQYCRAQTRCPEATELVSDVEVYQSKLPDITPEQRLQIFDQGKITKKLIDAYNNDTKKYLQAGNEVPGLKLKDGNKVETIINPNQVFARFEQEGVAQDQFLKECVKIEKTPLKKALQEATGLKGRELTKKLNELLDGCTTTTQNQQSIVRV